ncbi:flagellar biosynthetic protein FliR [Sporanaerobium hydrogeniformans]|uniref:Flagellar biosynthetic protein FliR n=1 Tax=Sporanaerobium hydrogeniformans TaxID=3072179 RepID=A0AC61DFM3_9FIRM|nr:flagellar biosynthetic protein FliR [Sporanaerobium hydrogeniformans]PHV71757.1 flagellar biosynthetic protein FliR [Sporanaerobium hydrogeniformans]
MEELMSLYKDIDIFLLVFCRIICAFIFLPVTEESKIPPLALSGLSAILALITIYTGQVTKPIYNPTLLGYTFVIVKECMVGLIISFGMKIFFQVYYFMGMLFGMQSGMSMSQLYDPAAGAQVPTIGRFYMLGFSVIFILSGGYEWFITILIDSYKKIPIDQAVFGPHVMKAIVEAISNYWLISFKLTMPILGVLLIIDWGLGILARTVPQMNMFIIGIPLKMLVLFFLLIVTLGLFTVFNDIILDELIGTVMSLIQGMIS